MNDVYYSLQLKACFVWIVYAQLKKKEKLEEWVVNIKKNG